METNTKVKIVALAMTLVIVAGLVNMTSPDVEADQKYTIQVVTNPDFPPYEYIVADSYEGIDMDIWKAIAQTLACDVNFNVMDFDSIINAIEAGRFDVGASGFTVTEERKQQINFSSTYATAQQTVLVLKNGPLANVTSWEDLKDKTIAVESGTTGYYLAADVYGDSNVQPYNTYTDTIQAVVSGYSGLAILDDLVAESFVDKYDQLKLLGVYIPGSEVEEYAFTINKSNIQMLQYTNKALEYLQGTGVIDDIFAYYGSINYDPDKPGYFSAHPEKLSEIDVITHYKPTDKYTIEIATNPDFPPYDYTVSGSYEGIDMDIWKAIGAVLDSNVNFNFMEFDSIINAIQSGRFEVGASGFTVTEERKQSINFSSTYAVAHQNVMLLKNSPLATATSWEQLKDKLISVESGTTGYYLAADVFGDGFVTPYNTYTDVVESVLTKHSDFAILDDLVAISYVEAHPNELMILDVEIPGAEAEEYAFVFNKADTNLLDYANRALRYLTETGVIADIYAYYGSISYDPEKPGYFSAHPEALEAIQVIDHYTASSGGGSGSGQNFFEWLWSEIIKNFSEKDRYQLILSGLANTVYITLIGLAMGLLIGVTCAIVRSFHDLRGKFRILNAIVKVYITVIRGTPILVQLLIIYFIVFASSGINSIIIAGIAFGINSGAYVAEIIRAGVTRSRRDSWRHPRVWE